MNVNGTITSVMTIASGSTINSISFAKGTYPIPVNGYCFMQVSFGSATTNNDVLLAGDMMFEFGA